MIRGEAIRMIGWRNGSMVKSTACPSKGPELNSQQPYGGSQPSVMRSGALLRKRPGQSSSTQTVKANVDKFNRTAIHGLPMHAAALPGHTFQISYAHVYTPISGLKSVCKQ